MSTWFRKHIHLHRKFDGMHAFYLNALLRAVVFAMVGIFIPIYIYELFVENAGSTTAIMMIAGYLLVMRVVTGLIVLPVSKIIEHIGFRRSILLSILFLFAGFVGLYLAVGNLLWLVFAAVMMGINVPFYWVSRHSSLVIDSSSKEIGKQIGFLSVLERVAGILGPVAGAMIITTWGYGVLYGSVLVILLVSVVPLFSMPHHAHRNGVSLRGFWYWLGDRSFFHQALSVIGRAMDEIALGYIWPFAIYMMGIGVATLGGLWSIINVISTGTRYVGGVIFDKLYPRRDNSDEKVFAIAGVMNSVLWIVRIFVRTVPQIFWADGLLGLGGTTYRNISDDYFYLGGKRMSEIAYVAYRELLFSIVVVFLMVVWMLGAALGVWKELLFLMISAWVLISIVQAKESNLK